MVVHLFSRSWAALAAGLYLTLGNGQQLRYHDPRRFGSWHWVAVDAQEHPLLKTLGPEPLSPAFDQSRRTNP